jgi:aminopeptidase N
MAVPNLTQDDARVRAQLLHVDSYDVNLDLTDGAGAPGERTFHSITTIRFSAASAGSSTFLDLIADTIHSVTLNGQAVDTSGYDPENGIVLPDLGSDNTVVVDADLLYTNTGEGLHRFVDPLDDEVYLYTQFETADAKRVYACFDQPDLKGTFTLTVTAPNHWQVISNGRQVSSDPDGPAQKLRFAKTARMSPYVTAVIAGPYYRVSSHHDGIDMALYCRESLSQHLDSEEIFDLTRRGFDWYHANFGLRYPFDKYDQIFVPEFNAGAMENAGAVTFREDYVFRSKVTDTRYERRAETLLHEMAHMWFGDLVTMEWWNDLWLNESFATYASTLCQTKATRWTNAWTTFANVEKTWAYRQDQQPSTHPIATDAPDVQTAEVNFDGITYAKGASVLKQLAAYVGVEEFLAGLRQYFVDHAYGNTTLADLLTALETTSGRDLSQWSQLWLETAGINTIRPEFTLDDDGNYASFNLVQSAPAEVATSNVLRPHRIAIGLYNDDENGHLVRTDRVELDADGERTAVPELVGRAQPALLVVNDEDLTYAKVRLDEHSVTTLRQGGIARLTDSLPRALAWSAAWDQTRDGELPARDYVALVVAGAEAETDIGLLQSVNRQALRALEIYADPAWADQGYQLMADNAYGALLRAVPASDEQLAWAHALLGAARSDEHIDFIAALLSGTRTVEGLVLDPELRWSFVASLSARGRYDEQDIDAELAADPSAAGMRFALSCKSLIPTAEAKEQAWQRATEDDSLTNAMQEAVIAGFAHSTQGELLAPYMQRYFDSVYGVWQRRTSEIAQNVVVGLFPTWTSTINQNTLDAADAFLRRSEIPHSLRRLVGEGRADVARAIEARAVDIAAGAATLIGI